jgi:hypothetical protein
VPKVPSSYRHIVEVASFSVKSSFQPLTYHFTLSVLFTSLDALHFDLGTRHHDPTHIERFVALSADFSSACVANLLSLSPASKLVLPVVRCPWRRLRTQNSASRPSHRDKPHFTLTHSALGPFRSPRAIHPAHSASACLPLNITPTLSPYLSRQRACPI